MKRILSLIIVLATTVSLFAVPISASNEGIMPCFNNVMEIYSYFTIDSNGKATIEASYDGIYGVTSGAGIQMKIQKRTLLFFWTDVDNGQNNNTWGDVVNGVDNIVIHSMYLSSKGTYRAIINYNIYGNGGDPDSVEDIKECTYN